MFPKLSQLIAVGDIFLRKGGDRIPGIALLAVLTAIASLTGCKPSWDEIRATVHTECAAHKGELDARAGVLAKVATAAASVSWEPTKPPLIEKKLHFDSKDAFPGNAANVMVVCLEDLAQADPYAYQKGLCMSPYPLDYLRDLRSEYNANFLGEPFYPSSLEDANRRIR